MTGPGLQPVQAPQWCPLASSLSSQVEDLKLLLLHKTSPPSSLQVDFFFPGLGDLLVHLDGERTCEDDVLPGTGQQLAGGGGFNIPDRAN